MIKCTYSVYNPKDDMPIIIGGTVKECAEACGVTVATFKSAASKQRHGKPCSGDKRHYKIFRDEPLEDDE